MSDKKNIPIEITPVGVAAYTKWLYEKDAKFAKDDPSKAKYKGTLVLEKGEHDAFLDTIRERHFELDGSRKNCPIKDGDDRKKTDDKGNKVPDDQFAGKWLVSFTSKFAPKIVDAAKTPIDPSLVKVGPGDLVKFAFQRNEIEDGSVTGCFLWFAAVQLIEKRAGEGGIGEAAASAFGATEGYVAPEAPADAPAGDSGNGDF
jgi:hypothetical protein